MKRILLAVLLAQTPLPELFIYNADTCALEDHLVAKKIRLSVDEQSIHLFSEDNNAWTSTTLLIQEDHEYFIKDSKKSISVRFDGTKVILSEKGACQ